jgi:small subunit ribosomal protein S10
MKTRIRLVSTDLRKLEEICTEIKQIADKTGVRISGPIPLPTKRLVVPTRKTPCGEGTHTWDKWEMRLHKRLIEVDANERFMKRFRLIKIPEEVRVSMTIGRL